MSCIEKLGVKSVLGEIVADLDLSIRVNLTSSVLSETPKFKSLMLPTVDATNIRNFDFAPSTRAKGLSRTLRDNKKDTRQGYTHDFETMSETTEYLNHMKNSKPETKPGFEREM